MKWNHIMDKQPEDGEMIIQIDQPYEGRYPMGMRKYEQKCSFEEVLAFYKNYDLKGPDFWWVKASEFPFPNQPERSKREDLVNSLIDSQKKTWDSVEIDNVFTEKDFEAAKMRCSEHCGDTVREVQ